MIGFAGDILFPAPATVVLSLAGPGDRSHGANDRIGGPSVFGG